MKKISYLMNSKFHLKFSKLILVIQSFSFSQHYQLYLTVDD